MNNDNAIHPLNPADRNPHVDYLGHAVSPEEFEVFTCRDCFAEVKEDGDRCEVCAAVHVVENYPDMATDEDWKLAGEHPKGTVVLRVNDLKKAS